MTDTLAPVSATSSARTRLRVTGPRVVLSEWTKFRSLRSTVYTLLMAVVFMIGLGALITAIAANQPGGLEPGQSPISTSLSGIFFAQLAIGVLGVLLISGEYSTGMIRSSLTVVPRRLPMLWGKLAVFAGVVLLTMLVASFTAFFVGQALLSGQHLDASLSGIFFAQLAIGVLGVLLISGEYSTGMIRSSLTVVPRRLPVLWGKLAVFAGVVFLTMLVASFAAFFVGQALLSAQDLDASLSDPGALRSVVGAALYVTVAGMTALALGALLRNTAAAITTFVAVFFVVPTLTLLLPASLTDHFVQYLPSNLGGVLTGGSSGLAHALAPWTGFGVLGGYAAVLIGIAAWRLRRVDA